HQVGRAEDGQVMLHTVVPAVLGGVQVPVAVWGPDQARVGSNWRYHWVGVRRSQGGSSQGGHRQHEDGGGSHLVPSSAREAVASSLKWAAAAVGCLSSTDGRR